MEFLGYIIIDRSDVDAKGQGQRAKVKVTDVMTPLSRFPTVTPVNNNSLFSRKVQIGAHVTYKEIICKHSIQM